MIRARKVLTLIVPLSILVIAVAAFWVFLGGAELVAALRRPPLVKAEGIALMDGKPMSAGVVTSHPTDPDLAHSTGSIDAQGRFTLRTRVAGRIYEGAYAGEHRVTVRLGGAAGPLPQPERLKEAAYTTVQQTPLRIELSANEAENRGLELELTGGISDNAPPVKPRASEGWLVEPLLRTYDTNRNQNLDADEIQNVDPTRLFGINLSESDLNQDGVVDYQELCQSAEKAFGDEP